MTATPPQLARRCTPVAPTATAMTARWPLAGTVTLAHGFWGDWQRDNTRLSIPHARRWMDRAGYLANLHTAAQRRHEPYRGPRWMDSDLYKVLEAIGWDGPDGDPDSLAFADRTVELLRAAQLEDGYLNSHFQTVARGRRWTDFAFGHEMYLGGHLIQAGVALARGCGDDRLLQVGRRFADHLHERFGTPDTVRVDGHPEIEMALVELYRETGEQRYLDLAALLVDARGRSTLGPGHFGLHYCQDETPLRRTTQLRGHAVRALYLAAGATDVAVETGDRELLAVLENLWDDVVLTKSYVTGGVGSHHFHEAIGAPWELPPDRAYAETCASIGKIMWAHRMTLATGDVRFADEVERVLHNGFAASTAADRQHFWYRNPLYQRELLAPPPEDGLLEERIDIGTRASWFDTACCPPNVMRTIAAFGSLVATQRDDTVVVDQLVSGTLTTTTPAGPLELRICTDQPATGGVDLHVVRAAPGHRVLVRAPAWSREVTVDGVATTAADGYLELDPHRERQHLELGTTARVLHPSRRIDALAGTVAVVRGPVVYAVEGVDLPDPDDVHRLAIDPAVPPRELDTTDGVTGLPLLAVSAVTVDEVGAAASPYAAQPPEVVVSEPTEVVLRPYASWANRGPSTMRVWLPVRPAP